MIIDASLFAWESDLLELRLRELGDVVDRFVIIEARETTRGVPRELVYPQVEDRYAAWRGKIDYYPVTMPGDESVHPQRRFGMFRDLLGDHLPSGRPDDVLLIGDGDEIPRASVVATLADCDHFLSPWALGMAVYYYAINCRFKSLGRDGPGGGHGVAADGWPVWRGPTVCRRQALEFTTPNRLREGGPLPLIPNGGWHFSFLFRTVEEMQVKLRAQGHIEYDDERKWSTENLEAAVREGRDWDYDRNLPLEFVPIDDSYPRDVLLHPERWAPYIAKVSV